MLSVHTTRLPILSSLFSLICIASSAFGSSSNCLTTCDSSADLFSDFDLGTVTGAASPSSLLYGAGDNNTLFTFTTSGAVTSIGNMGHTMNDIAMYAGVLYGIDNTNNNSR